MDSVKLPLLFDATALQQDLAGLEHVEWIDHFVNQNYEGSWTVIPLRGPRDATHPVMMIYSDPTCTAFADTPYLEACPNVQKALARFECPLNAVRLMRLTPGSIIKEHEDYDLSLEDGVARLHIPITSNPSVDFRINDRRIYMAEGECWYLRLSDPHMVANRGDDDRVHLVIDVTVNEWLTTLIDSGALR